MGGRGCAHMCCAGAAQSTEESATPRLSPRPRELDAIFPPLSHARSESTDPEARLSLLFCLQERKLSFTCIESSGSRVNQIELSSKQGEYRGLILGAFSRTETQT